MIENTSDGSDQSDAATTATEATRAAISTDYKIRGKKSAPGGTAVLGHNTATSGESYGVEGQTDANADTSNGIHPAGVAGRATGSGATYGIYGRGTSKDSVGILGDVTKAGGFSVNSGFPTGIVGATDRSSADSGVTHSHGVVGYVSATSGEGYGVVGQTNSPDAVAVRGWDLDGNGLGVLSDGDSRTEGNHEVTGYVRAENGFQGNVGASVYLSSNQSIANDSDTRIAFDSEVADDRNEFDTTNHEFVCAEPGDYQLDVQVQWYDKLSGQTRMNNRVFVNRTVKIYQLYQIPGPSSSAQWTCKNYSKVLKGLSAGDKIYVTVEQDSGGSRDLSGGGQNDTYMTITQVG